MRENEVRGFPGGIHPTDGYDKTLTMRQPVREYWPDTVTILGEQSMNAKCDLLVKAGDKVSTRQAIGKIFTDTEDGNATILHFQLWKEKTKLNPAPWLD